MSVTIMAKVWERAIETVPKLILLKMADHANDQGGSIYPGAESLRLAAGVADVSTVRRRLKQFKALGILVDDGEVKIGRTRRRVWRLDLTALRRHFPLAKDCAVPPSLNALAKAAPAVPEEVGDAGDDGLSEDDEEVSEQVPEEGAHRGSETRCDTVTGEAPHRGPGARDTVAPQPPKHSLNHQTNVTGADARDDDPGGSPPATTPEAEPPERGGAAEERVCENRNWKPARHHFVQRRSEPEALAWWDPLIAMRHDDDGTLVLDAPSEWHVRQVEQRYSRLMEMALQQEAAADPEGRTNGRLRFVVEGLARTAEAARKAKAAASAPAPKAATRRSRTS